MCDSATIIYATLDNASLSIPPRYIIRRLVSDAFIYKEEEEMDILCVSSLKFIFFIFRYFYFAAFDMPHVYIGQKSVLCFFLYSDAASIR